MSETVNVLTHDDGQNTIVRIIKMLEDKIFSVETIHSTGEKIATWDDCQLCKVRFLVKDSLYDIPLCPRRNICFDLKDKPMVIFESDESIVIVRILSSRDTVTRIVKITGILSGLEKTLEKEY